MAVAPYSAAATPPLPRADRHRQHPPPVWWRAVVRRRPPYRHRRVIAATITFAAVPPPLSGVRGRSGHGGVPPYPRRAALRDGGAELSPVDPLSLLQPPADHALQLPHAAAQRLQLPFVSLLGFLGDEFGRRRRFWARTMVLGNPAEDEGWPTKTRSASVRLIMARADFATTVHRYLTCVHSSFSCSGRSITGRRTHLSRNVWRHCVRGRIAVWTLDAVCKTYRKARCLARASIRRRSRVALDTTRAAAATAATAPRVRTDAKHCRDIIVAPVSSAPTPAATDSPSRGGGRGEGGSFRSRQERVEVTSALSTGTDFCRAAAPSRLRGSICRRSRPNSSGIGFTAAFFQGVVVPLAAEQKSRVIATDRRWHCSRWRRRGPFCVAPAARRRQRRRGR